jgi:TRAP-type C4-dicarboxylate transport system substrate-binding protein
MPPPDIAKYSGTFETWAREFEKLTNGRYQVEVVHGGALASIPKSYDAVATGIADIAQFIPQDTDRPFPMSNVVALPFLQVRSDITIRSRSSRILDLD